MKYHRTILCDTKSYCISFVGSYNLEEAEYRDNKINEEIHRSLMAEVAAPKVVPPKESKSKLYTSPVVFAEFDNNAIQVKTVFKVNTVIFFYRMSK